jgi:ferritin-like metal-binding protein YciE
MPRSPSEQLVKYLADAHSIEEQALTQLRAAPEIAGEGRLSQIFREHLAETERHERLVRERLEAHGADRSRLKDAAGEAGGYGMVLFAIVNPDTPGKLTAHAFSYEHMELAAYDLLARVAEREGDTETVAVAERIRAEEDAMSQRIATRWDAVVDASLLDKDAGEALDSYLADAHALEAQAIQLLDKGKDTEGLQALFSEHLAETRHHSELIEQLLEARGGSPSKLKDAALAMGALNWGAFFKAQPDTPAKLAGFAYAFEALEVAGYELLSRTARRAGEEATAVMAERICGEERTAAERVAATWDAAADAALAAQGVA